MLTSRMQYAPVAKQAWTRLLYCLLAPNLGHLPSEVQPDPRPEPRSLTTGSNTCILPGFCRIYAGVKWFRRLLPLLFPTDLTYWLRLSNRVTGDPFLQGSSIHVVLSHAFVRPKGPYTGKEDRFLLPSETYIRMLQQFGCLRREWESELLQTIVAMPLRSKSSQSFLQSSLQSLCALASRRHSDAVG
jgi:hypothetical protein